MAETDLKIGLKTAFLKINFKWQLSMMAKVI